MDVATVHTVQHSTIQYNIVQYSTVQYRQYSTVKYRQYRELDWICLANYREIFQRIFHIFIYLAYTVYKLQTLPICLNIFYISSLYKPYLYVLLYSIYPAYTNLTYLSHDDYNSLAYISCLIKSF